MTTILQTPSSERPINRRLPAPVESANRDAFAENGVVAISIIGGQRCGKTALLAKTLQFFHGKIRIGVVVANVRPERDAQELRRWCDRVMAVETNDLSASVLNEALPRLDLMPLDLLLIEGPAAVKAPQDLGESARVAIFSVSGGDDNVERYAERLGNADLLLLTKTDLLPLMPFDRKAFGEAVRRVNPALAILDVSAANGLGMNQWFRWLHEHVSTCCMKDRLGEWPPRGDYFFG